MLYGHSAFTTNSKHHHHYDMSAPNEFANVKIEIISAKNLEQIVEIKQIISTAKPASL